MDEWGFVIAGYLLTAVGMAAYAASLFRRARRARERAAAAADARDPG